ncbi:MAG: hydratase, partial [Actinomycetota bacterium]|nr:hydratase [Actinomycetota bacterium]
MRIACAQYAVREGDPDHNLELSLRFIRQAAAEGVNLVILPELANSGCDLGSRERALDLAEELPDGPTVRAWRKEVENYGVCVVGGLLEREGDILHNSAVLLGYGVAGRYRKTHLWDKEKLLY